MSDSNEYYQRRAEWSRTGAVEKLRMEENYRKVWSLQETNPELGLSMLTQCREEAQRLSEPWWVLYFDYQRLATLSAGLHDFARALPLAQELMVRFSTPEGLAHSEYDSVYTAVLYTFLSIDPVGFRNELERGFCYLDAKIPREPIQDRFIFDFRRAEYLNQTERRNEAFEIVMKSFASTDHYAVQQNRPWHKAWHLFLICPLCHSLGKMEELAGHAQQMEDYSRKTVNLKRVLSAALIWRAVVFRANGDEQEASRMFHEGLRYMNNLAIRDEVCAEQIATYYALGREWKEALSVREQEFEVVQKKGMLHRACMVLIERCRLLKAAGELTPADLDRVRQAAARLRVPVWYLERLAKVEATSGSVHEMGN